MSEFIRAIDGFGLSRPEAVAFSNSRGERMTFGELKERSDAIAAHLAQLDPERKPVVVYGHKSPLMIACFLACAKSGRAYVPTDVIYPDLRIADIIGQLDSPIVLNTSDRDISAISDAMGPCLGAAELAACAPEPTEPLPESACLTGDETFYILFTSGSTGHPKGVEVSAESVDNFWKWMLERFSPDRTGAPESEQRTLFGRAPFSFDVSLGDMAMSIGAGDAMYALVEEDEDNLSRAFDALATSGAHAWSSTPTFAEMCLRDPSFSPELLPNLSTFILAGEALKGETVIKLLDRFPGSQVINAYGPTESTDLVSTATITREMAETQNPLPIGYAKTGTDLYVLDPETLEPMPNGEKGELFIVGNTVAKGYFGRPDLTEAAFGVCPDSLAKGRRSYRTGDAAIMADDGCVYYYGRLDFQVKLHGFRIELGEIEAALCRLDGVMSACVLPVERRGTLSHLAGYVVSRKAPEAEGASNLERVQAVKDGLRAFLPEYMIPRKIVFIDEMPLGASGKVDRKRLQELG